MPGEASADPLRIRYYEWCSARVAEQFLRLSPEEVWHRVAPIRESVDAGVGLPPAGEGLFAGQNTFEVVRVLAQRMADEMRLPSFDHWVEEYRRDPARFEQEIIDVGGPAALTEPLQPRPPARSPISEPQG